MSDLYLHYKGWKPEPPEDKKAREEKRWAEHAAKRQQAADDREAKKIAKKAEQHQANLEAFREKVRNSHWPEEEKVSLIAKSYLW